MRLCAERCPPVSRKALAAGDDGKRVKIPVQADKCKPAN